LNINGGANAKLWRKVAPGASWRFSAAIPNSVPWQESPTTFEAEVHADLLALCHSTLAENTSSSSSQVGQSYQGTNEGDP